MSDLGDGTPAGRRVSLRHRLPGTGADGRPRFADVVGTVERDGAGTSARPGGAGGGGPVVTVRRDDGSAARVRTDRVVAVRDVPPARRPARGVDPDAVDRLAARHWPARESVALGEWELRAAGGFTRRANAALAVGSPGVPLAAALERVRRFAADRGLVARVSTRDPAVVAGAVAVGWERELTNAVLTVRVADVLAALPDPDPDPDPDPAGPGAAADGPAVGLADCPGQAWLADYRDADTHPDAAAVLAAPPGTVGRFATLAVPGWSGRGLPGRGRVVVSDGWAGLSCVAVAPELQRRGLGARVVAALLDAALDAGAVRAYLQVETDNVPALALYRGLGFRDGWTTTYLREPDA